MDLGDRYLNSMAVKALFLAGKPEAVSAHLMTAQAEIQDHHKIGLSMVILHGRQGTVPGRQA
jgi:hypothetical protein